MVARARLEDSVNLSLGAAKEIEDLAVQPYHVQAPFDRRIAVAHEDQVKRGHNVDHLASVTSRQKRP